jgi:hypothetical protein
MRVAVELVYVQSCPECLKIASELAVSCIADRTVTGFRAVPGRKHAHEVTEGTHALKGLTDATTGTPEAAGAASALPVSDNNGASDEELQLNRWNGESPNGYDDEVHNGK